MANFPAVIQLPSLDGTNGFQIVGAENWSRAGVSVATAGDVNGDGIDDLIIGARGMATNGYGSGSAYILFGSATGFAASVDLSSLNGANGFRVDGAEASGAVGKSVSSAGDVNGDGIDDFFVGAHYASPNGTTSGAAYVVFGRTTGFSATLDLSTLNGADGFKINGVAADDRIAREIDTGDFNGDGISDLIISGFYASPNGRHSGSTYVVFGRSTGFSATFELSGLDGTNGFKINGEAENDQTAYSVSSAGDVNGDHIDDMLVGGPGVDDAGGGAGAAYVVFGRSTGFGADVDLSSLDGTNGFQINAADGGQAAGVSVSSAGDINGDGVDDVIFGAIYAAPNGGRSGSAYVVFGRTTGFGAELNASTLNGSNGFRIDGLARGDQLGWDVAALGDFNGDGIDDLIVGARSAGNNGAYSGSSYVVFGRTSGFGAVLNPATLDGTTGLRLDGAPGTSSGSSVYSAGDINGDGGIDLVIGAPYSTTGSAYVVYAVSKVRNFAGTVSDDSWTGSAFRDQLYGQAGNDILYGLGGDDLIDGGDLSDQLFGGDGKDTMLGGAGGDIIYGDNGDDTLDGGDGNDKLFGGTGADNLNGGTGNDRLDGEANIDTLRGGAGNDTLDGGFGADFMYGGGDNDIYIVDDADDKTIELANEGYDIVRTTLDWTLSANVEALQLQGSTNVTGTGNAEANNLQGNAGDNTLYGLAGVDTINGNDGNDIIVGGVGNDLLRGGLGADIFKVSHAFGSVLETDQIYDFSTAEGDQMDFRDVFAETIQKVAAFNHTAGAMTLTFAAGITTVRLDIDGNNTPDYQVKINGDVTGDWAGWLL